MKTTFSNMLLAAFGVACAALTARADTVINAFDSEEEAAAWGATWGTTPEVGFSSESNGGASGSGALRVSADYFTPADNGWEQMVITRSFETPVVGRNHVSVSVDVKVDPASIPSRGGNYGYFELKRTDGSSLGGLNLTSTNWTTLTFPLAATEGNLTGLIVQNGNGGFQGPVTYYLDNLVFKARSAGVPKPTLAVAKNTAPGLKLYASAPNEAFQRQNIVFAPSEDLANGLWWVNQPTPITYSITWADFPDKNSHAGFQGHILLVPDSGRGQGNPIPDYSDPNAIMVEFQYVNTAGLDGTNGTPDDEALAQARVLHKVNEPNGNGMLYRGPNAEGLPVGVLGQLRAPAMLGTWSVRLEPNSTLTLTAPDASTTTLTIPAESAPLFEPTSTGVSAHFGIMPNSDSRVGQSATVSRIQITKGASVVVDEDFKSAELDPTRWIVRARSAEGVFVLGADTSYLVRWNLPDDDFVVRTAASVGGPWSVLTGAAPVQVGAQRFLFIKSDAFPGAKSTFFQLRHP